MRYVLPGMGATNAMFKGPWRGLGIIQFLDWPEDSRAESIKSLAREIIQQVGIKPGDTVMGTSLGGIVACEISNQLPLDQLILIGNATKKDEINPLLRTLSPLIDLTPLSFVQQSTGSIPSNLTQMFSMGDPQFIRRMSKAVFSWDGHQSNTRPFRIHGTKDSVIPLPNTVDLKIDGGHLIAMTHPEECTEAIRNLI